MRLLSPNGIHAQDEDAECRRIVVDSEGPLLIEGPVEIVLPDGSRARSDRFMAAVCTCRRSRRYPWCDTSHRRRTRQEKQSEKPEV
jgi:CDGSH-type Zn-finger protein